MAEAPKRIEIPLTVEHDGETVEVGRLCYVREDVAEQERDELRELVSDMWGWLTARTVSGAALHDISGVRADGDEYETAYVSKSELADAVRERDELRELVRELYEYRQLYFKTGIYPTDHGVTERRMRELGIEVPE